MLSFINLVRLTFFSVASDLYDIKTIGRKDDADENQRYYSHHYHPLITIIVPAHNEEVALYRNLVSIVKSSYKNVELIIVNDSSDDRTKNIALLFQRKFRGKLKKIKVLNVNVRGKAKAMNKGLRFAKGSLFMCLDADSVLTKDALKIAVEFFREKRVGALASNVKIIPGKGMLNLLQRIEYMLNHQMKKAEAMTRIQYIVGGVGSMYRMRILRTLNGYDTDTITEDIDLSMKMILHYKDKKFIGYDPSMVVFSESVASIPELLKQRNRWKYGRYQAFLKRRDLFFSKDRKLGKLLSWFYLPYALFSEIISAIEPLMIGYILYLIFVNGDFTTIAGSVLTFCFYTVILTSGATQGYSIYERTKFAVMVPIAYLLMYILSCVEYIATIKGFYSIPKLLREHRTGVGGCEWTHVKRAGGAVSQ
ncbi:MAG: glycosyltransferase [Patescibacteria group bacterium]